MLICFLPWLSHLRRHFFYFFLQYCTYRSTYRLFLSESDSGCKFIYTVLLKNWFKTKNYYKQHPILQKKNGCTQWFENGKEIHSHQSLQTYVCIYKKIHYITFYKIGSVSTKGKKSEIICSYFSKMKPAGQIQISMGLGLTSLFWIHDFQIRFGFKTSGAYTLILIKVQKANMESFSSMEPPMGGPTRNCWFVHTQKRFGVTKWWSHHQDE